jgi:hypothetical protein
MSFYVDTDTDLYLSLIDAGIKTKVINRAVRELMQREALVDLDDGKRPVNFWDLAQDKKDALVKTLSGQAPGKADDHLWVIVQETSPQDFYLWAAKYLALHQLKFGKPYVLPPSAVAPQALPVKLRKHFYEKQLPLEPPPAKKTIVVILRLSIMRNSKFVRGVSRTIEDIQFFVLPQYSPKKLSDRQYELTVEYEIDKALDDIMYGILDECHQMADSRNCFSESSIEEKGGERYWD